MPHMGGTKDEAFPAPAQPPKSDHASQGLGKAGTDYWYASYPSGFLAPSPSSSPYPRSWPAGPGSVL
jgi:hypothetical protein